ncbi:hypothetical protein [Mycobacterium ulcerans]|uniref:hypothetical protein n=1 Tax=Mycobacterium ulcerans TaxID=1809 RepID=UPI001E4307AC|nr:hypothetical protein [Mycobacterium ulcerans]
MGSSLRVYTAGVQAMAWRWGIAAGELTSMDAPAGLGLSCQLSAAAVDAAHGEVAAFTTGLAIQVNARTAGVTQADSGYLANEAASADVLAAVAPSVTRV